MFLFVFRFYSKYKDIEKMENVILVNLSRLILLKKR